MFCHLKNAVECQQTAVKNFPRKIQKAKKANIFKN
jgi:hypothetical protein